MNEKPFHPTTLATEILMFLSIQDGRWATWGNSFYMPSVQQVFPVGTSHQDQLTFMRQMQKDGLVGGCDCGCRGDYVPTILGLNTLSDDCISGRREFERLVKEKREQ